MNSYICTRPLSDMGVQGQQRVFQKQCIDCCNMRCPNQNKDIENILKCPEYLASPRPEAQQQDAAAGKAALTEDEHFNKYPDQWYIGGQPKPDTEAERLFGSRINPASPGKAGDVLAELEQWINENATVFDAKDGESYVILEFLLKKIAALRQVQQQ